jgi:hypothetical protein
MTDQVLEDLVLVGSAQEIGDRLAALARRYRPRHLGLSFLTSSADHHLVEAQEVFAVVDRELRA